MRETAFVSRSAIITFPGKCCIATASRMTRSRRNSAGTQYVLGVLKRDRILRHGDGGLRVREDKRRRAEDNPQIQEEIAQPKEVARGKHATKVFRLGAAQRDRLLRLGKPMEETAVVEDQAATHREACAPT